MNEAEKRFRVIDHTRPFLEVIKEQAPFFHPYPQRLVELFETLPREYFVPDELREVFLDRVQTDGGCAGLLSQPGVIFEMVAYLFLHGKEQVFEGGTGTGYQTAILARLAAHVTTVERDGARLEAARKRLTDLGITNVTFVQGDAAEGYAPNAPFDRMIFGAALHGEVDRQLIEQMAPLCRLLAPTGNYDRKRDRVVGDLLQVDQRDGQVTHKINPIYNGTLYFVPLVSPRLMGWTPVKDGYVPSSTPSSAEQKEQKQRRFPWSR